MSQNDKWILEFGDRIEREFAGELRQFIPQYETNWSTFIGNDGTNEMVGILGLREELYAERKAFSEHHYTIAESILCINQCVKEMAMDGEHSAMDLIRFQNQFLAYFAHVGRVYDNVKSCLWYLGDITGIIAKKREGSGAYDKSTYVEERMAKLSEFWNQRHVVLHGKKVPLGMTLDGQVIMPVIRKDKVSPLGWASSLLWNEFDKPVELTSELTSIFRDFCGEVNHILCLIYEDLMRYLKDNQLSLLPPSKGRREETVSVYNIDAADVEVAKSGQSGASSASATEGYSGISGRAGTDGTHGSSSFPKAF